MCFQAIDNNSIPHPVTLKESYVSQRIRIQTRSPIQILLNLTGIMQSAKTYILKQTRVCLGQSSLRILHYFKWASRLHSRWRSIHYKWGHISKFDCWKNEVFSRISFFFKLVKCSCIFVQKYTSKKTTKNFQPKMNTFWCTCVLFSVNSQ